MTGKKTVGKFIEYIFIRVWDFQLMCIPFRLRAWMTEQIGIALYHIFGKYRRLVLAHLEQAFPDSKPEWRVKIAKQNFRNMGRLMGEINQTPRLNDKFFKKWMVIKPGMREHIDAFEGSRIQILGHLGNWEWHGFVGSHLIKKPVYTLVKRHTNFWSNGYLERTRNSAGMRLIYVDQNPFIVVKRLRAGDSVAFTSDQDARGNGEFFPFFNKPASTFTGPAVVARNAPDAKVFFIWSYHDEKKRLVFDCEPLEMPRVPRDDMDAWEHEFTHIWVKKLEEKIRAHPADYLWAHNRWKR